MVGSIGSTACTVIAAVLSIIAVIVFFPCRSDAVNDLADVYFAEVSGTFGIAWWLTLVGFILMCLAALFNTITFCVAGGNEKVPTEDTGTGSIGLRIIRIGNY